MTALDALVRSLPSVEVVGATAGVEVVRVAHDSRDVTPGTLYACLRGDRADGHDFAPAAVDAGAVALLVDHPLADVGVPQLVVDDTRRRLGPLASAAAGFPSRSLTTIGVTGTNGKTTTAMMLATIFDAVGRSAGVVGTLSGPRTTPEAPELQRTLADFVEAGRSTAVLEVSSHALTLHRVDGTEFDAVAFTNFGHDHLDLHGTPEEYFRAKASLFRPSFSPLAVINADDTHGQLLIDVLAADDAMADLRVVPYTAAELDAVQVAADRISYRWRGIDVEVGIGGTFNVSNSLGALVIATELGVDPAEAAAALGSLSAVPGRFETVVWPEGIDPSFSVIVDYAHTPDGIREVLRSARSIVGDRSVIVAFGCGGDRDQGKRPEMGAAAVAGADLVVVTSDNPRTEDPQAIIDDILGGVDDDYRDRIVADPDRRSAMRTALGAARPGDIVVIAGKGHETTQDLGGEIIDFDDRAVARSLLQDIFGDGTERV